MAENSLLLGQEKVRDKENEIPAIPEILDRLVIDGAVVSIDAMGTQVDIAEKIVGNNAHYFLAVKENQAGLLSEIQDVIKYNQPTFTYSVTEKEHARMETSAVPIYPADIDGEYILYPENFGSDMSLDETCLSNGDVYTILTNKDAHGGKGALAAMVRGVASDTVSVILRKVPLKQRLKVKTVTTDLSSAMMLTVRNVFPGASLVNDRFHVQQLISEAVDQLRIRHRWEVLDAENKAIREHRQKRKDARSKEERELIGKWEPERMENGETMPQIMARSRHIILKHKSKWNEQQTIRARILFRMFPDLEKAYGLFLKLVDIFNEKTSAGVARLNLARWYNEVEAFGNDEFNKVLETFENHNTTIINYFERRLTNASAESFNAKIKAFRTQFRGVGDIKFFMFRLSTLYS